MQTLLNIITWLVLWGFTLTGFLGAIKPQSRLYLSNRKHGMWVGFSGAMLMLSFNGFNVDRYYPSLAVSILVLLVFLGFMYAMWRISRSDGWVQRQPNDTQWYVVAGVLFFFLPTATFSMIAIQDYEEAMYVADAKINNPQAYKVYLDGKDAKQRIEQQRQQAEITARQRVVDMERQKEAEARRQEDIAKRQKSMRAVEDGLASMPMLSSVKGCGDAADMCLSALNLMASKLQTASRVDGLTEQETAKVKEFRYKLVQAQKRLLPVIRKAYEKEINQKLWEYDISARVTGTANRTLILTGSVFSANRYIGQTHSDLKPLLVKLRYNRVDYRWSDLSYAKFTRATLDEYGDDDILTWGDQGDIEVVE